MDTNTFYAVTSAICFTLVGLWWSVVKDKPEWFKDEARKRLADGVYASFLIPALMSLGAQVGGDLRVIWQGVFVIAALGGIISSGRLIGLRRKENPKGAVSRNSWVVPVLYGIVLIFAVYPNMAEVVKMKPLQMEGLMLCLLIYTSHALAWEFMTSSQERL